MRQRPTAPTGKHTEGLFGRAGRIVRCERCALVRQLDPPVAPYEEASDEEYLSEEPGIRRTFAAILDRIARHRPPPGNLLDIGCGPGLLLDEAQHAGWVTRGVEPSAWGAAKARERGLDVAEGRIEDLALSEATFDAIVAADVVEHVADPVAFAIRVHDLLAPGGVAFIATPNVDSLIARVLRRWWWSVIPNHLVFFSPATLTNVLQRAGLRVIEASTHPKTFSIDYYAGRLGGYSTAMGKASRRIGRMIGGADRLVTPDFRDRIAVIARRAGG